MTPHPKKNEPWRRQPSKSLHVCVIALSTLLPGCVSFVAPATLCPRCSIQTVLDTTPLPIEVLLNQSQRADEQTLFHIYLEGDGRNWWMNRVPPSNPSSTQLTALKLMMSDPYPAAYLQRPCYGQKTLPEACNKTMWTTARYSTTVIAQMSLALDDLQKDTPNRHLVLIGHSGGGSMAMLLAAQRQDVSAVITLGANLDHQAWTQAFGFSPLNNSLNAIDAPLPRSTLRWHYAAPNDEVVPWKLTQQAARLDPQARFHLLASGDHTCCWQQLWPSVLQELHAALADPV